MKRKKILIVCPYPQNVAPSQRLKFEQYYPYFRQNGYELTIRPFINEPFWKIIYKKGNTGRKTLYTVIGYWRRVLDLFKLGRYDIVYVHLWVTPFGPPFFEWLFRQLAKKIVYDIDDLVYLGNIKNKAHPIISWIKGKKKPVYLMKTADHVITCTPYLDQFVRKYNQQTTDISSTINTALYRPKQDYSVKEKFVIGWSGSYSTSKYLHLLDDVFLELAKEHNFKLLVMGDADFKLTGVDVEALPWKEHYEIDVINRFDVGVYPLPDEEWVLGKSGLKALQYMALGIPTIATSIGTIHRIIKDGENGFLVHNKNEWKQAIVKLIQNEDLRREIGRKAVITVEEKYSLNANNTTYLRVLEVLFPS
jgi:L-malate glycosyltransferase